MRYSSYKFVPLMVITALFIGNCAFATDIDRIVGASCNYTEAVGTGVGGSNINHYFDFFLPFDILNGSSSAPKQSYNFGPDGSSLVSVGIRFLEAQSPPIVDLRVNETVNLSNGKTKRMYSFGEISDMNDLSRLKVTFALMNGVQIACSATVIVSSSPEFSKVYAYLRGKGYTEKFGQDYQSSDVGIISQGAGVLPNLVSAILKDLAQRELISFTSPSTLVVTDH